MNEREPVGTIAEEASRLMAAIVDWAKDTNVAHAGHAALEALPIATGADECLICPVCQLLHVVKGQKPEVYDHLQSAALSLALAAKAAFDEISPREKKQTSSEKISINFDDTSE
jgi:hypothetical protein